MNLDYSEPRCTGNWLGLDGEFGRTLNPTCFYCQRRLQKLHGPHQGWIAVEVLQGECKHKIVEATND